MIIEIRRVDNGRNNLQSSSRVSRRREVLSKVSSRGELKIRTRDGIVRAMHTLYGLPGRLRSVFLLLRATGTKKALTRAT